MKQLLQNVRTGELGLVEVPAPRAGPGQVLVRNTFSVVSPGTEKLAMQFARQSLLQKARSRPDLVRQVARKLRQDGPAATLSAVRSRLEAPQPLGYSSAGTVVEVGAGVAGFAPGDRVACAGAGYANHAELVAVPENLVAPVPPGADLEDAAFATLGAIALQGVRIAAPQIGEVGVVVGLGILGQLTVQLLRAAGCRVLAVDLDSERVKQALDAGADWGASPTEVGDAWKDAATGGHGADFAVVTAGASSSAPIHLAAGLCRARGRLSVVGAMPMELDRRTFYEKELELRMSMSYGPGRYDRRYEELGLDYPYAHVRWTENRNLRAVLDLMAAGSLQPRRGSTAVVDFDEAPEHYERLARGEAREVAIVLRYRPESGVARRVELRDRRPAVGTPGVAVVGAGAYARSVLLPAIAAAGRCRLRTVVTATGATARQAAERFGFEGCASDPEEALADPEVDLVFVATRHDSHAELAARALRAGKSVFVEKPLGLTPGEVDAVLEAAAASSGLLAVGYNRRFSAHARAVRRAFEGRHGPLSLHYRVAAGPPPAGSWILDPREGGGRLLGEVCHFVDLLTFLVGAPPQEVVARAPSREPERDDTLLALLTFPDGSTATLAYLARTAPDLPKESFEVHGDGRTAACENFRRTRITGERDLRTLNQDKGQRRAVAEVLQAVRSGGGSPFAPEELRAVSETCFALLESLRTGEPVRVGEPAP